MDIFNAPSRETCAVRRERTNTPLQALVTLNDPQFVESAKKLAMTLVSRALPSDQERLNFIGDRLLCRPWQAAEQAILLESLRGLRSEYQQDKPAAEKVLSVGQLKFDSSLDPVETAAWTMLINEVMNLDELLNK
jgi:hypothetical protein